MNKSKIMFGYVEKIFIDWISLGLMVNYFDIWFLVIVEYFLCSFVVLFNK